MDIHITSVSELKNINLFFCSIQQLQYCNSGEYLSKYF